MKHTLFACLLLGVTLSFCIFSSVTVRAETQTVNDAIASSRNAASRNDFESAAAALQAAKETWESMSVFSASCSRTRSWTRSTLPLQSFCNTQLWRTRTIFSRARRASPRRSSISAKWKCRVITISYNRLPLIASEGRLSAAAGKARMFTTGSRFLDKA